jgi:hypothetical protein
MVNTGIFWDYENVPLRNRDHQGFLTAFRNFMLYNDIHYARVYARRFTISQLDQELINSLNIFDFKFVNGNNTNAVDFIMMQSCYDILRNNNHIRQAIIITGDGDFADLLSDISVLVDRIILIYQKANYNECLFDKVHSAYSVNFIVSNSHDWWEH